MWTTLPLIGFDTETTGVDPRRDRLVTCSLVRVDSEGSSRRYWLADPGVDIPEAASQVHGITTEQARAEGRPIAEVLGEIVDILGAQLAAGQPVVAFNASYDFTLLESELARHGLPTLSQRLGGEIFPVIDPYLLDRGVDRYRKGKRRLENLVMHYGVFQDDSFHNAEADVVATLRVLEAMLERFPQLREKELREIVDIQIAAERDFQEFLRKVGRSDGPKEGWPVPRA
ncbi:exonuclease domain-containing protein [Actinotignum schaalii]|uniref:exonuclease domain-containing protein n=1 Tax=Actinotignum schaalii TaxID=59505 RepID=UPI00373FA750